MVFQNIKIRDLKSEIGQLIKSLRKRDKLSQEELAQSLDLSRITIQNLESGKNFTIDTLLKALQHFDLLKEMHQVIEKLHRDSDNVDSLY
ncbi:MAG: helix-turn-helix transcriptional regulator [Chitinophagales bacterium]